MTAKNIIQKGIAGDRDARAAIYEKYYGDVYRYCVYRTGSLYDGEDMAQETFLRLYKYSDIQLTNPKAYILKVASNVCSDHLRSRPSDSELDERIPADAEPDEDRLAVRRAIASLPDDAREVIILYYYNGLKLIHISKLLSLPLSTVKSRLVRGRLKLKQILIQEGF